MENNTGRRWRGRVLAVAATTVVGLAAAAPAQASAAYGAMGWVRIPNSQALPGSSVQTVQGQRVGGSCVFTAQLSLSGTQRSARADEVGYNPLTCQAQLAVLVSDQVLPQAQAPKGQSRHGSSVSTAAGPGPVGGASPNASSSGYFHSETWDPVGLEINMVENGGTWSHGSCVTGGTGYNSYWWLSNDGWQLSASNFSNTFSCSRQDVSSYAHFYNFPFCGGTNTFFNRNHFYGNANGSVGGTVAWSASGCLSNVLSVHYYSSKTA